MSSPSRLAADAANGQRSTRPRGPKGKARSCQKSLKHGLTARDDEREGFEAFEDSLRKEINPRGALEQDVFGQFLHAAWNLRILRRAGARLAEDGADGPADQDLGEAIDRLVRHRARLERAYYRALRELRTLRRNR